LLEDGKMPPMEATTISPTSADIPEALVPFQANLKERVRLYPAYFVTSIQIVSGQLTLVLEGNCPSAVKDCEAIFVLLGGERG